MSNVLRGVAVAVLVAVGSACGGDSSGPSGGNSSMSATVDGTAWTATIGVTGNYTNNVLSLNGTGQAGGNQIQLNFALPGTTGTGPIPLGTGNPATVSITINAQSWVASLVGGSGQVNLEILTSSRAKGTFTINGIGAGVTAGTTRSATNGQFDVRF